MHAPQDEIRNAAPGDRAMDSPWKQRITCSISVASMFVLLTSSAAQLCQASEKQEIAPHAEDPGWNSLTLYSSHDKKKIKRAARTYVERTRQISMEHALANTCRQPSRVFKKLRGDASVIFILDSDSD